MRDNLKPYRVVTYDERHPNDERIVSSYHETSEQAYEAGERITDSAWRVEYYSPAGWAKVTQCPTRAAQGV